MCSWGPTGQANPPWAMRSWDIEISYYRREIYFQEREITARRARTSGRRMACFFPFRALWEVAGLSLASFIRNACEQQQQQPDPPLGFHGSWRKESWNFADLDPSYASVNLKCRIFRRWKKKRRSCSCSYSIRHWPSWMGRIPAWMWMQCTVSKCGRRIPEAAGRRSSDHHPQHQDSGSAAVDYPRPGERTDRPHRRRFTGG